MEKKTHTFQDGAVYEGEWRNGRRHGQGTWTRPDGYRYTGEWADDKPNGLGILALPGGRKYIGEWKNGKRHGLGIESRADGTKITGKWEQGRLITETTLPAENEFTEEVEEEVEGDTKYAPAGKVQEKPVEPEKEQPTAIPVEAPAEEDREPGEAEQQPAEKEFLEEDSAYPFPTTDQDDNEEEEEEEEEEEQEEEEEEEQDIYSEDNDEEANKPIWRKWWFWVVVLLAVLAALIVFFNLQNDNSAAGGEPNQAEEQNDTADPGLIPEEETLDQEESAIDEEEGPLTIEAGTYLVNEDIEPGLYRSEGGITYFERLSGLSGERKDVIANGAVPKGPVIVEVKGSDAAFRSEGNGTWYMIDDSYQPELKNTFGDGCWIVGVDIEPGTYKTDDDIDYWARLANFSHEVDAVIANDAMVAGGAAVEIKSSDAGFISQGQAVWTKID